MADVTYLEAAIEALEKANAGLEPELVSSEHARELRAAYARIEKLAAFGLAALTRKLDDATELARTRGCSVGEARAVVDTGRALGDCAALDQALRTGEISLDQGAEIARAEAAAPGAAPELLQVARERALHVLKDKARAVRLEAEARGDLFVRQRQARSARERVDALGMVEICLRLQPHVGAPVVARAQDTARSLARAVPRGEREPFEAYLADAYARMLAGGAKGSARRPELVVVVSHEVAARGWDEVRSGEVCKIPGVGPIEPSVARQIAARALVNAVVCDGKDLREFKRFSRSVPVEVALALSLGDPPGFDGAACVDCGARLGLELDHVHPYAGGGASCLTNLEHRCGPCHDAKTRADRGRNWGRDGPEP